MRVTPSDPAHGDAQRDNPSQAKVRFKRNSEEIRLGLTIEQAKALREKKTVESVKEKRPAGRPRKPESAPNPEKKSVRFRRTMEEIRLGLTREEAAAHRGVTLPERKVEAPAKKMVVSKEQPAKPVVTDLIDTLSPKTRARARAVQRYRLGGGKAVLTAETLDQIEMFARNGKVKVCPPCTDSDGYNYLTQQEVR